MSDKTDHTQANAQMLRWGCAHADLPVQKQDRRQSMRSIFGSLRGHVLDSEAAHAAPMSSQGSAPPVLQDAEGFVPRRTLQDLRMQAVSRSAAESRP